MEILLLANPVARFAFGDVEMGPLRHPAGYCRLSSVCARSSASLGQEVRLAAMPFGNSEMDVPEGQMKIAQRFNAGMYVTPDKVPKGRLKHGNDRITFGRPFGTRIQSTTIPALKRRAILGMSLRDIFPLNSRKALPLSLT